MELVELCTTLRGRLRDRSLTPEQPNYDDFKRHVRRPLQVHYFLIPRTYRTLITVEGQLAVWSDHNPFMSLSMFASLSSSSQLICLQVKRKIIRVGIRGFIGDLRSVVRFSSSRYSGYLLCTRGFDRLLRVRKSRQAPSTYLETGEKIHLTQAVM